MTRQGFEYQCAIFWGGPSVAAVVQDPELQMLVDPFHGGEICFLEDAEERLNQFYAPRKVRMAPR